MYNTSRIIITVVIPPSIRDFWIIKNEKDQSYALHKSDTNSN